MWLAKLEANNNKIIYCWKVGFLSTGSAVCSWMYTNIEHCTFKYRWFMVQKGKAEYNTQRELVVEDSDISGVRQHNPLYSMEEWAYVENFKIMQNG